MQALGNENSRSLYHKAEAVFKVMVELSQQIAFDSMFVDHGLYEMCLPLKLSLN